MCTEGKERRAGDESRPHPILHLPLALQRGASRPNHQIMDQDHHKMNLKIPAKLHLGERQRFTTLLLQDH
eukprot:590795-Amphidinium_carterae.1